MVQTEATEEPDGSRLLRIGTALHHHRHPVLLLLPAAQLQLIRQVHIQFAADRSPGHVSNLVPDSLTD